ncbi:MULTISPECIES: class F sortase [Streptomyces]|uniref:class F sortase n=1 Tax=Streptomyces TaxID=1883 RepID=UPI0013BDC0AC|nr:MULTISPECIES: class F sortase [Streptomyces]MBY8865811.1 class F sortase [Streptomyces sennicomposti]MYX46406.1 class F sortase [Streptomyces sp. SID89]NMO36877.1 class F sortase [Streptomyces sp. GMY02]
MSVQQPSQNEQSGTRHRGPHRRRLLWPAAAVGLGLVLIHNSLGTTTQASLPYPARPKTVASAAPRPKASASPDGPALPRSEPKRISIPDIGVDAPFTNLSIGTSGQLNAPPADDTNLVGWFQGGVSPGERGASIVVGHVDTKTGPAVFAGLSTLEPGSDIDITRADGTVANFKVDALDTFSKADFPDDEVYADTPDAELRLITCGGPYDRTAQDYEANLVVFAHLDSTEPAE